MSWHIDFCHGFVCFELFGLHVLFSQLDTLNSSKLVFLNNQKPVKARRPNASGYNYIVCD